MWVSCARHATATGLSSPLTTGASFTRTRARSGVGADVVVDAGAVVEVLVVGAGLIGGSVLGSADVAFEPLPHAASVTIRTHAETEEPKLQE